LGLGPAVLAGALIVVLLGSAAVASAADVTGQILANGQPVTVTTTEPSQRARLTFTGSSGQRVFVKASDIALTPAGSYEIVDLLNPSDGRIGGTGAVSSVGYIDTKTLLSSGPHSILVDPAGSAIGSTTLRLFDVPPDFAAAIAIGGTPGTTTTTVPGQDGRLSFVGSADQPVRVWRSGATIPASVVKVLRPDGTTLASSGIVGTPDGHFDTTLPASGTYTVLVDGFQDATGQMTIRLTNPEDDAGVPGTDQTPPIGDETGTTPAAPAPVAPTGAVPPGSYSTQVWSGEETGARDGLRVVSSTAAGTAAWTGLAMDGDDGTPVAGATVTLTRGSDVTSTTTDSDGAYAFINMPPGSYTLDIASLYYGTFTVANAVLDADELYQETAGLFDQPQTLDLAELAVTSSPSAYSSVTASDTWTSNFRPPPTIRVAMYAHTLSNGRKKYTCDRPTDPGVSLLHTKTYPWRYYVLRTLRQEIGPSHWPGGPDFPQTAVKAVAQAIHSYAWNLTINRFPGLPAGADLNNTVNFQCFIPGVPVAFGWHALVNDVLRYRTVDTANPQRVRLTFHLGDENCVSSTDCPRYESVACTPDPPNFADTGYPPSGVITALGTTAVLSQLGAKAAVEECNVNDWISLVEYYYRPRSGYSGGRVVEGTAADTPPPPKVSHIAGFAYVDLQFPSRLQSGRFAGWKYNLEKLGPGGYTIFKQTFFDWDSRTVPTTYRYWTNGCTTYRVNAVNSIGKSAYVYFNNGLPICT
jgi:Carboxypeptidase regulatory-like domain